MQLLARANTANIYALLEDIRALSAEQLLRRKADYLKTYKIDFLKAKYGLREEQRRDLGNGLSWTMY